MKHGLAEYGMAGVGDGKDSEGSDWIVRTLETDDDRPLWIAVWGGANTLAQALYRIKASRSAQDAAASHREAARVHHLRPGRQRGLDPDTFPDLFYIVSPGGYGDATWTAINTVVPGIDNTTISNRWLAEHIQQGHGPLGAVYPDVAYGMEGDTPSWLALVPNGLNVPEHPEWGGWGGRYERYRPDVSKLDPNGFTGGVPIEPETRPIWSNAVDEYTPPIAGEYGRAHAAGTNAFTDFRVTLWRWRDDFQNDFAARMDWTTKPFAEANHPPRITLKHANEISVRSGESLRSRRARHDRSGRRQPELPLVRVPGGRHLPVFVHDERRGQHGSGLGHRSEGREARDRALHPQGDRQGKPTRDALPASGRHGSALTRTSGPDYCMT